LSAPEPRADNPRIRYGNVALARFDGPPPALLGVLGLR
jgi:hypothetical protein